LVSIGVPVYNGENYLRRALESITKQTYRNLQILIADNASTDGTEAICREFAARDDRIRYHRHPTNLGASANHAFVLRSTTGKYFRVAAHDDEMAPTLVERCVELLEADPQVVVAITRVLSIDDDSTPGPEIDGHLKRMSSSNPIERFGLISCRPNWATPVFGVMRREAIEGREILGRYTGADRTFLAEMALAGPWRQVDELLFFRRGHATNSTKTFPDEWQRRQWFDTSIQASSIAFPQWRRLAELAKVVDRSSLNPRGKVGAYLQLARWIVTPVHRPRILKLLRDPLLVATRLLRSSRV
jgi:glycosyltransferase involved in cell wall biosynthesis